MEEHDPIKNPRPEDLSSYGVVNALIWFAGMLAVAFAIYFFVFKA